MKTPLARNRSAWATAGSIAYIASLALPAVTPGRDYFPGIYCLLLGWIVPVPWSANVLLFAAVVARGRASHRWALAFALLATCVGATAVSVLQHPAAGFYAWIGSMVAMAIASATAIPERDEPLAWARLLRR